MTLFLLAVPAEGGGFNPLDLHGIGGMLWTWIIFAASLPLIWKVVMGPVTRALLERDSRAEQAVSAAEKASREAQEAQAKLEITLGEAQATAAKLVAEARTKAEARGHEIVEAAKAEAGALVDGARKAIRVEQDKAIAAIRNEVVDLSLRAASKVLDRTVGGEDDRRFVTQVLASERIGRG